MKRRGDDYRHGDFNRICDASGFKVKASQTRMQWNGLIVDQRFWEPRHPQDFVRGRQDKQNVVDPRPERADVFLDVGDVTADDL